VETRTARGSPSTPGPAPSGEAVAWSVPVGTPVTARPVVVGDALILGSGEHGSGDPPGVDAELRPRFPGYVHAVGLDGRRRFRYAAPAPVLDVAPVAGDDAARDDDAGSGGARAAALGAYAVLGWYGGPGGVGHRLTRVVDGRAAWRDDSADVNRFVAASTADAVVTGTRDERVASTGEHLTARAPSGAFRWRGRTGDVLAGHGRGERAYLTVGTRRTRCLDASTGDRLWSYPGTAPSWQPRVDGETMFVARNERTAMGGHPLVALDADSGRERWAFAGSGDESFAPVATATATERGTADAMVYVAGTSGDLWAVEAGRRHWRTTLGGRVVDGPVVADGVVYATDTLGTLYAVDAASGERAWTRSLDRPSRALDANATGVVAVAATIDAADGDTYGAFGFGPDGSERYRHEATEGVAAALARDGRAFVVTANGHLAAFGARET